MGFWRSPVESNDGLQVNYKFDGNANRIRLTWPDNYASACAAGVLCQQLGYDDYGNLSSGSSGTGELYRFTASPVHADGPDREQV
jgi:hypothetical protein